MSNTAPDALAAIKQQYSSLSDTERKVADYILKTPERVVELPLQGLCALTGVSNGSVINFCAKVGFQGYTKLKLGLAQSLSQRGGWVFDEVTSEDTIKGGMKKIIVPIAAGVAAVAGAAAAVILLVRRHRERYGPWEV